MKKYGKKILIIILFSFCIKFSDAQQSLQQLIAAVDTFNARLPAEQFYIHFDKKQYAMGDTIWFKAYLLQRSTHAFSPVSGILYLEVISDSNRLAKRISFPAAYGLSWGQIALDRETFAEGNYYIRAYTNWMQNFGEDYFYTQRISISDPLTSNYLVTEDHKVISLPGKTDVDLTLRLNNNKSLPEKEKEVEVKILNGKKIISRQDMKTTGDGILKTNFSVPVNTAANDISILIQDKTDINKRSTIPVLFNRPQNIDLQFMPESGYLVAGIPTKVGFKAISESGLGIEVQGKIVDSRGDQVARFKSAHKGMGAFQFIPLKNENYFAVADVPGGNIKRFSLPAVKNSGIVLQVENEQHSDSIRIRIRSSIELTDSKTHLVALSRGVVCYAANIILRNREIIVVISKKLFPSGIAHFTCMDESGRPMNERVTFIDHSDNLSINVQSISKIFSARDSIPFHIKITDKQGQPVTGSFSISITDDSQVRTNDIYSENIVTRMLLTADLKGNIEEADYYLDHPDSSTWQSLDALLLTQGWVGYEWPKIIKPPIPSFYGEKVFKISGKVTNITNSPINNARVVLMSSGSRVDVKDTVTDKNGEFVFSKFKRLDSIAFLIDARNAKNKKFGIGLKINEFKPAEIKTSQSWNLKPWYVNSDSTILNFTHNQLILENESGERNKYKKLQEVRIKVKKSVKGSSNLNGPGGADQVIDEAEIVKEGNKSLIDLLKEKVKGFIEIPRGDNFLYKIFGSYAFFVIDGINIRNFGSPRDALESLDATDVTGIEVMYQTRYVHSYSSSYLSTGELMNIRVQYAFIEITTRSGNGFFSNKSPGLAIYKPVPMVSPVQFYSPKYTVNSKNSAPKDMRSTIFWQPALISNKKGEAETYFYAADNSTTYTLMIQGSDINGSVGYKIEKISIR